MKNVGADQDVTISFISFSDAPTLHFSNTSLAKFTPITGLGT